MRFVPFAGEALASGKLVRGETIGNSVPPFGCSCTFCSCRSRRCETEPHICLHVILRHTIAVVIHNPEVVLRVAITLVCRQPIPPHGFLIIVRHTVAGGEGVPSEPWDKLLKEDEVQ